jgi:predicted nucleotidyltransferase
MGTKGAKAPRRSRSPVGSGAADALFSKVQQRVLGVLFGRSDRSFYANEIIAIARSGTGAVQRELARLEAAGLITAERIGRQKHFQANPESPLFEDLRALSLKTFALADVLREALTPLAGEIRAAFVFGSIAKGTDGATSDVDVFVIADDLGYADLMQALEPARGTLRREISPHILSQDELASRLSEENSFVTRVLAQPKLWLLGDEHAVSAGKTTAANASGLGPSPPASPAALPLEPARSRGASRHPRRRLRRAPPARAR